MLFLDLLDEQHGGSEDVSFGSEWHFWQFTLQKLLFCCETCTNHVLFVVDRDHWYQNWLLSLDVVCEVGSIVGFDILNDAVQQQNWILCMLNHQFYCWICLRSYGYFELAWDTSAWLNQLRCGDDRCAFWYLSLGVVVESYGHLGTAWRHIELMIHKNYLNFLQFCQFVNITLLCVCCDLHYARDDCWTTGVRVVGNCGSCRLLRLKDH